MHKLGKLWEILGPVRAQTISIALVSFLAAALESAGIGLIMPALELLVRSESKGQFSRFLSPMLDHFPSSIWLTLVLGAIVAITALKTILRIAFQYLVPRLIASIRVHWMGSIMKAYLSLPFSETVKRQHGELLNNLFNEPNRATQCVNDVAELGSKLILTAFLAATLLAASWQTTLLAGTVAGMTAVLAFTLAERRTRRIGSERQLVDQNLYSHGSESLAGLRQILLFSQKESRLIGFENLLGRSRELTVSFEFFSKAPIPVVEFLVVAVLSGGFVWLDLARGSTAASDFVPLAGLMVIATRQLMANLAAIGNLKLNLSMNLPALLLVDETVRTLEQSVRKSSGRPTKPAPERCPIRFRNVTFSYSADTPVLKNSTLEFPEGKITLLLGPSGSGKSTVLDLISGLIEPNAGFVEIDGTPLHEIDADSWRRKIGYVSQDTWLFNASIGENISLGNFSVPQRDLVDAAQKSGAWEFIQKLPRGLDTPVGDRGLALSGGQRQRIAVARAILRNPTILLFDEPTSALDHEAAASLLATIERLKGTATIVIVSHDRQLARIADVIHHIGDDSATINSKELPL